MGRVDPWVRCGRVGSDRVGPRLFLAGRARLTGSDWVKLACYANRIKFDLNAAFAHFRCGLRLSYIGITT